MRSSNIEKNRTARCECSKPRKYGTRDSCPIPYSLLVLLYCRMFGFYVSPLFPYFYLAFVTHLSLLRERLQTICIEMQHTFCDRRVLNFVSPIALFLICEMRNMLLLFLTPLPLFFSLLPIPYYCRIAVLGKH